MLQEGEPIQAPHNLQSVLGCRFKPHTCVTRHETYSFFLNSSSSRNLSRYSSYHERTFSCWYARDFDFVSLNKAAITQVIPPEHEQALVSDASLVPTRHANLRP
jgi:hypothetical protein